MITASVPIITKILGIPCPACGALIASHCDESKQMICAQRLAQVILNDALKQQDLEHKINLEKLTIETEMDISAE